MPWLTDALGSVGQQLSALGGTVSPEVLRQVNQATAPPQLSAGLAGLGANPGQFVGAVAPPPAPEMGEMQFNAAAPSQFANDFGAGQFFAGNVTPPNMGGSSYDGFLAKETGDHPWQLHSGRPPGGMGTVTSGLGGGGGTSVAGGQWSTLDSMNGYIDQASASTGVPANLIKAMLAREGSFGNDKYTVRLRNDDLYAFNGMFRKTAESRGIDFDRMLSDDAYAVWAMGETLRQIQQETGFQNWDDVAGYYFAGPNFNNPNWGDETGVNTVWNYTYGPTGVITRWHELDQMAGTGDLPTVPRTSFGNNWVVQQAMQYVGTPYAWGAIPGKGADPRQTGWDCSGMTYWLDQNYGTGQLPMGSHYQYQYAQQTGQLFNDVNQLQPGDLVFWDTGNMAGAGAELNRAGHVAVYIGNGQILHAANPSQGTIVSDLNSYLQTYGFLGAMHQSFSGGVGGFTGGGSPSKFAGRGSSFVDYLFG